MNPVSKAELIHLFWQIDARATEVLTLKRAVLDMAQEISQLHINLTTTRTSLSNVLKGLGVTPDDLIRKD